MPVKRQATVIATGTAAMAASRMQSIRKNEQKRRERESLLSLPAFSRFIVPV